RDEIQLGIDLIRDAVRSVLDRPSDFEESKAMLHGHIRDQITNYLSIFLEARVAAHDEQPTALRVKLTLPAMREPWRPISPMSRRFAYELMDMFDVAVEDRALWPAFFERVDEFERRLIETEWTILD